jgi:hypothetical protein
VKLALVAERLPANFLDDELANTSLWIERDCRWGEIYDFKGNGAAESGVNGWRCEVDKHTAASKRASALDASRVERSAIPDGQLNQLKGLGKHKGLRCKRVWLVSAELYGVVVFRCGETGELPLAQIDVEGAITSRDQDLVPEPEIHRRCLIGAIATLFWKPGRGFWGDNEMPIIESLVDFGIR